MKQFIIFSLLLMGVALYGNEKITDVIFVQETYKEYRAVPVSRDKLPNFGYYRISLLNNYFENNVHERYQAGVPYNLLQNAAFYREEARMFNAAAVVTGVLGGTLLIPTIVFLSLSPMMFPLFFSIGGIFLNHCAIPLILFFFYLTRAGQAYDKFEERKRKIIKLLNHAGDMSYLEDMDNPGTLSLAMPVARF